MTNSPYFKSVRLWLQGLLLLALRWAELKTGFDPDTGLSRHSLPGILLAAAILFCAAAELWICLRIPGGKRTYLNCLEPMGRSHLAPLAAGSILLCGEAMNLQSGLLSIATAAAGVATMLCLIYFVKLLRGGEKPSALFLLPAMVYSVLFLLTIYLPEESDPVLAHYYLPVLAAALAACAFYQLAGLTCREGSLRWFVFFGDLTVPLCLASMADYTGDLGHMLAYFGYALILTQFLLTRRSELLPEPEPEEEKAGPGEAAQA